MWTGGVRVIIFDDQDRLLMVRQSHERQEIWMLPGGGVEAGENAAQCAVREVKEETGLDIRVLDLLWHVEEVSHDRGQRFVNFFTAEIIGGSAELGYDPEFDESGQILRELKFIGREEMEGLNRVYPEFLRKEVWLLLKGETCIPPVFRVRK